MAISTANAGTQTASACVACRCSHPIRYHLLPYLECFEVVDEDVRDPEVVDEEQVDRMELLAFLRTAAAVAKALVLKSHIHCRETPMSQYLLEEGYRYPQCRLLFALLPTGRR